MNRIEEKFIKLKEENKTAFIAYVTAGDPNLEQTEKMTYEMEKAGADIIEIGIPFSDPAADGPVIQKAAQRALDNGVKIKAIFETIEKIRKNSNVPLVFLVYYNSIYRYGAKEFIEKCEEVGIDGLIIPDLPSEERDEISPYLEGKKLSIIPLVAPNSFNRMEKALKNGSGFVYCISSFGVTGMRSEFSVDIKGFMEKVRTYTNLPLALGFGISTKEDVKKMSEFADGVIVGSAIVKVVEETNGNERKIYDKVKELRELL